MLRNEAPHGPVPVSETELTARLRAAAMSDLKVFRAHAEMAGHVGRAHSEDFTGFGEPVTTSALANAVTSLDDLILVAAPGMGKTTTFFQIAEGILAKESGVPLVVPLGDWATEGASLLDSF